MAKAYLRVRDLETGKSVHSVAINNLSDRHVERVMLGMLRNMNRDKYFIDDGEVDAAKEKAEATLKEKQDAKE